MAGESNSGLLRLCVTILSDWFEKRAPLSQPIRSKRQTIFDLSSTNGGKTCVTSKKWFGHFLDQSEVKAKPFLTSDARKTGKRS